MTEKEFETFMKNAELKITESVNGKCATLKIGNFCVSATAPSDMLKRQQKAFVVEEVTSLARTHFQVR